MKWVQEKVSGIEGLSFKDNVGWMATGSDIRQVVRKLESCARESIDWAVKRELEFNSGKTGAALFTCRRGHINHLPQNLTAKIRVGNGFVRCNKKAI